MMELLLWMIKSIAILASTIIGIILIIVLIMLISAIGVGIHEGWQKGRGGK